MIAADVITEVRRLGVAVKVSDGNLHLRPANALTPELIEEIRSHKPELIQLLNWRESEAHKLLKDALAYLGEFYIGAGSPACDLGGLDAHEERIDEAFAAQDMFLLRIAVREWVQEGVSMFNTKQRKGTTAA